jgi:hypothetical protein
VWQVSGDLQVGSGSVPAPTLPWETFLTGCPRKKLLLWTHDIGFDLRSAFEGGSQTLALTDVFQLKIHWAEVQLSLARATLHYYFLVCSIWLELFKNVTLGLL